MPSNDNGSPIDELKKRLYSKQGPPARKKRASFQEGRDHDIQEDWRHEHNKPQATSPAGMIRKASFATKFLITAIIFFLVALGIAAFIISREANVISSRNVDMRLSGPVAVAGGEVLPLQIEVVNRNSSTLESAELHIEYPEGTRNPEDSRKTRDRLVIPLNDIAPGTTKTVTAEALVFGGEGSEHDINIGLEYRVSGSNAIFAKDKIYTFQISSAPIALLVDAPTEVNTGQEVLLTIDVESNATTPLEDVLLVAEYPFGFEPSDASPRPSFGTDVWDLGDIAPGSSRSIEISGTITGQDNEERTFRFTTGVRDPDDERTIGTPLLNTQHTMIIARPLLDLDISVNGNKGEVYTAESGRTLRVDVEWTNNLPVQVADAEIQVQLSGEALDESSVSAEPGFYQSRTNTITWDERNDSRLATLEPGERGRVSFDFHSIDLSENTDLNSPQISFTVVIEGVRRGDSETAGIISSSESRQILFESDVMLGSRITHFVGPFENSGPIPPEVDEDTTYTVIWSLTNASNDVIDGAVTAALPSYVEWVGSISPASEDVTFNPTGGQVNWDVGLLEAGAGFSLPPREVAFQIRFTPSLSQVGDAPELMSSAVFRATDKFTDSQVTDTERALTTNLRTDALAPPNHADVIE